MYSINGLKTETFLSGSLHNWVSMVPHKGASVNIYEIVFIAWQNSLLYGVVSTVLPQSADMQKNRAGCIKLLMGFRYFHILLFLQVFA